MTAADAGGPTGLVVVDKPGGMTSHDVVARVRRLAGTRKVGHAGTLDPMATGVLVLGLGRATRLLGHLLPTEKVYDATIRLGLTTTTDDADGEVVATSPTDGVTEVAVRAALEDFRGEIEQVPTAVSAIKVDGRRAYQRVRDGEQVELEPRRVTVHELVLQAMDGDDVRISMRCSSGTYVRAIARDLGQLLGVGGHLTALRRTAVGPFGLDVAHGLDDLERSFALLPIGDVARTVFPAVELDEQQSRDVRVGRALDLGLDGLTALFDTAGVFLALYEPRAGRARATAVFV